MVDKIINYFNKLYKSDLKYSNSVLNTLKIFFERGTKSTSNINLMGNLYKSSKWTPFQTQNINIGWLKDWATNLVLTLFFLGCIFYFEILSDVKWKLIYTYMALCENIVPNLYYLVIIFLYFPNVWSICRANLVCHRLLSKILQRIWFCHDQQMA
jgi:hypothetical protein